MGASCLVGAAASSARHTPGDARRRERPPAPPAGGPARARGGAVALVLLAAPLLLPAYSLLVLQEALVLALACLGLNLLLGTSGLLSLGHAAYFGLGGYAGGLLYTFVGVESLEVYLAAGVAAAAMAAAAAGVVCVRATRIHFSILTLAFTQILHSLFVSGIAFRPFGGVGHGLFLEGGGGLYVPRLTVLGRALAPEPFGLAFYYVVVATVGAAALLLRRIDGSPFARALRAGRDNELRALCLGIPVRRFRWYAFVLSGTAVGLAGGLFGQLGRQVTPQQLGWFFSAELVLATVLGGTGRFWGPAVGAGAVVVLRELSLRFTLHRSLVLGLLLVAVTLLWPGGLASALGRARPVQEVSRR